MNSLFIDSLVAVNLYIALFLLMMGLLVTGRLRAQLPLRLIPWCFSGLVISISLSHASWFVWPHYLAGPELALGCLLPPLIYWAACAQLNVEASRFTPAMLIFSLITCLSLLYFDDLYALRVQFVIEVLFVTLCVHTFFECENRTQHWIVVKTLSGLVMLLVAQIIRHIWSDVVWLREIVPFSANLCGLLYVYCLAQTVVVPRAINASSSVSIDVQNSVLDHLADEDVFSNVGLRLPDVARDLHLPVHIVSEAINSQNSRGFNSVLNGLRIAAFIDRYEAGTNVERLAYEVGFQSRSAFYRSFKKQTGLTPSEHLSS